LLKGWFKTHNQNDFIRTLSRFIVFEALSYLGSVSRGWHDSLSGTYVVKKRG
jgi:hypothetical protein